MALIQLSALASSNGKRKQWSNGTTRQPLRSPRPAPPVRFIRALRNPFRQDQSNANLPAGSTLRGGGSDDLDQSREVEEGGVDNHFDRMVELDRPILSVHINVEPQNPSGEQLQTNMQPRAHLELTPHRQGEATVAWPLSRSPHSLQRTEKEKNGRMARRGDRCVALVQFSVFVSSVPSETLSEGPERRKFACALNSSGGRI